MVNTYAARFRLMMAPGVYREHGELVPEAHLWRVKESWVHAGKLADTTVPEAEFKAAVKQYCPEQADAVLFAAGVGEGVTLMGPNLTPVRRAPAPTKPADPESTEAPKKAARTRKT